MMAVRPREEPRLGQLLAGIAPVPPALDRAVRGLTLDSRNLQPGELFLACAGSSDHGLRHLPQARAAGACAILWEPPAPRDCELATGAADLLCVPGLRRQAGLIASRFYGEPAQGLQVIGVTGTDGKTSCSHFLAQCLSEPQRPCGLIGTLGAGSLQALTPNIHTTPDPILLQRTLAGFRDQGLAHVAMEVSSHALDQGRVSGIAFRVGVLTNLTRDHLDYHGDLQAYRAAKTRLFQESMLGAAVLNADDELGRELLGCVTMPRVAYAVEAVRVARAAERFVIAEELVLDGDGLRLSVATSWGAGRLRSALLGRFNASNLLAVLATLLELGLTLDDALSRLSRLSTAPGRMERFGGTGQPLAVVDYAHTPHALGQALGALREHTAGRLWCVFGCGGDRDRGKRAEMARAAEHWADRVIVTDDNPRTEDPEGIVADILRGFAHQDAFTVERDRASAIALALHEADPEDVVLVAGKGHEDYQIVGTRRLPFSDRDCVQRLLAAGA
jgi:UDP-N-acetylmuramoyl-L-alanyl-D-glutamate--2,6-diaminopimelate ligase